MTTILPSALDFNAVTPKAWFTDLREHCASQVNIWVCVPQNWLSIAPSFTSSATSWIFHLNEIDKQTWKWYLRQDEGLALCPQKQSQDTWRKKEEQCREEIATHTVQKMSEPIKITPKDIVMSLRSFTNRVLLSPVIATVEWECCRMLPFKCVFIFYFNLGQHLHRVGEPFCLSLPFPSILLLGTISLSEFEV